MNFRYIAPFLLLVMAVILTCGCMEPPIREPTVTVKDVELADVSLRAMTLNTTVVIHNPNAIGASLNKVAFDVYYADGGEKYLGHGERTKIDIKENGNTTVIIPVRIENAPALAAFATLIRDDSLNVTVNGSAFIDIKLTEYEMPFARNTTFTSRDFEAFIPLPALAGTGINVSAGLRQIGGLIESVTG